MAGKRAHFPNIREWRSTEQGPYDESLHLAVPFRLLAVTAVTERMKGCRLIQSRVKLCMLRKGSSVVLVLSIYCICCLLYVDTKIYLISVEKTISTMVRWSNAKQSHRQRPWLPLKPHYYGKEKQTTSLVFIVCEFSAGKCHLKRWQGLNHSPSWQPLSHRRPNHIHHRNDPVSYWLDGGAFQGLSFPSSSSSLDLLCINLVLAWSPVADRWHTSSSNHY